MNKTRKHSTASTSSDSLLLQGKQAKLSENAGQITQLSSPAQEISAVWKTSIVDGYSDKDAETWYSLRLDLLHSFDELATLFRFELQHNSWLNAYLLAAGMDQIVEDYLHENYQILLKAPKYLAKIPGSLGGLFAGSNGHFNTMWASLNNSNKLLGKMIKWQQKLAELLNRLAELVMSENPPGKKALNQVLADGGTIMAFVPYFPSTLRERIIKLPSCFRSFDQRPEDFRRIVDEFSLHWPEKHRLITVIGARTSGSYLAPLFAALLKQMGYDDVHMLTIRPSTPLLMDEQAIIREMGEENGLVLLCDDPPISGSTLAKTACLLEETGIPRKNIVLLLQLFGNYDSLPDGLQQYPSVLLSWSNWSIHRRIEPGKVREILEDSCDPAFQLTELERLPYLDGAETRGHMRAVYRASLVNNTTAESYSSIVQVEGVGLGYFGEHALAIAQRLPDYSARVITFKDGVLFQEISANAETLDISALAGKEKWVDQLIKYIVERSQRLPAGRDASVKLVGRQAVWEIASILLSSAFGPASLPARIGLVDRFVKDQLTAGNPSIIDGDMALKRWYYQDKDEKPFVKTYMAERDFSHLDMYCYDPVYDLAGIALEVEPAIQCSVFRRSYESASGDTIIPERWMLYQLVHLWDQARQDNEKTNDIYRRMAQVVQRYFSEIYFKDLETVSEGPLCAIDIDGVLESKVLGFPSLTPASARSLRALNQHGYRVILATGRSLPEIEERCAAYRLNGGVAEYGAVLFDQASGQVKVLITEDEQATLYKLRGRLSNKRGIYLDNDYRFAVRAYCLDDNGKRTHLDNDSVEEILVETDTAEQVYAVQGLAQTDFMVKRIDKGHGIREWLSNFDKDSLLHSGTVKGEKPLALAVGDSGTDLPMLNLASHAWAPSNASWEVKQSEIPITTHAYQSGLEQAVTKFLGHLPGSCLSCAAEDFPPQTAFVQDIFAVQENGPMGMLWQAIKLFRRRGERFHVNS